MKFLGKVSKALLLGAAVFSLASCGDEKKKMQLLLLLSLQPLR